MLSCLRIRNDDDDDDDDRGLDFDNVGLALTLSKEGDH